VRRLAEQRANRWYYRRLAGPFMAAWEGQRSLAELREYLGDRYDHERLVGHRDHVDKEEDELGDEQLFYRSSEAYLYDLTAFAMSGTKEPYLLDLRAVIGPGRRLLDYGCGIGADGLRLLDAGYHVEFADFDNPSTRYLRWRLAHRGITAPVHDIDQGGVPRGFDLAYAFDVIEHVEDPFAFLDELESRARFVMVNLLEPDPDDTHLHRPLPIRTLLQRAARRGIIRYRRHHGRSHVVIYRSEGGGVGRRARSSVELALGGLLDRAAR
jgi:2-polyprenyl-3-methyl-5-hydroxy-6-metoxy-1,4-benzoquinol methylase